MTTSSRRQARAPACCGVHYPELFADDPAMLAAAEELAGADATS